MGLSQSDAAFSNTMIRLGQDFGNSNAFHILHRNAGGAVVRTTGAAIPAGDAIRQLRLEVDLTANGGDGAATYFVDGAAAVTVPDLNILTGGPTAGDLDTIQVRSNSRFVGPSDFTILVQTAPNLVAHWTFDDPADRFADSGPRGIDLTPVGVTAFAPGISGDALSLSNTGKANANFADYFLPTSDLTLTMWADLADGATDFDDFWGLMTQGASDSNFVLEVNGASQSPALFQVNGGIPGGSSLSPGVPDLGGGGFRHLAVTMDQDQDMLNLYVDGVLVGTASWDASAAVDWLTIGGRFNTGIRNINALIDDVQLYNYALDDGDIAYLFANPGQVLVPEPATTALLGLSVLGLIRRRR